MNRRDSVTIENHIAVSAHLMCPPDVHRTRQELYYLWHFDCKQQRSCRSHDAHGELLPGQFFRKPIMPNLFPDTFVPTMCWRPTRPLTRAQFLLAFAGAAGYHQHQHYSQIGSALIKHLVCLLLSIPGRELTLHRYDCNRHRNFPETSS